MEYGCIIHTSRSSAREMQDTFYHSNPSIEIDEKRLEQWKEIHEHGGDTEVLVGEENFQ